MLDHAASSAQPGPLPRSGPRRARGALPERPWGSGSKHWRRRGSSTPNPQQDLPHSRRLWGRPPPLRALAPRPCPASACLRITARASACGPSPTLGPSTPPALGPHRFYLGSPPASSAPPPLPPPALLPLSRTHTHTPCRRRGRTGRRGGARTRPLRPPTAARSVPRVGAGWQGGHGGGTGGRGGGSARSAAGGGGRGVEGEGEGRGRGRGVGGGVAGRGGGAGAKALGRLGGTGRHGRGLHLRGGGGGGSDSPAHALTRPPGMTHSRVLRSTTGRGGVAGLLAGQTLACTGGAPSVRNPGMYPRYEFSAWRLATLDRTRRCLGFPRLGTRWCRWTALTYGPGPGNPCHNVATVVILMVRLSPRPLGPWVSSPSARILVLFPPRSHVPGVHVLQIDASLLLPLASLP